MRLSHKLDQWTKAKLITSVQARKIEAFEMTSHTSWMFYLLLTLAGTAIGLGIAALVASNWQSIPDTFKLTGGFVLLTIFLSGTYIAQVHRHFHLKGLFLTLSFLMTGAQIGLIGQVFQCAGSVSAACLLWSLLTFPMIFLASWIFVPLLWVVVSLIALPELLEILEPLAVWLGLAQIGAWIEAFYHSSPVGATIIVGAFVFGCFGGLSILANRLYQRTELSVWRALKGLMLFFMFWTLLMGEMMLRWWHSVPLVAIIWTLSLLGVVALYEGVRRQQTGFARVIVAAELYLFYVFAVLSSNLWSTGWGLIAFGCLILGAVLAVKKTTLWLKRRHEK